MSYRAIKTKLTGFTAITYQCLLLINVYMNETLRGKYSTLGLSEMQRLTRPGLVLGLRPDFVRF